MLKIKQALVYVYIAGSERLQCSFAVDWTERRRRTFQTPVISQYEPVG